MENSLELEVENDIKSWPQSKALKEEGEEDPSPGLTIPDKTKVYGMITTKC